MTQYLELCESPIERKMAIALAYAPWPIPGVLGTFQSVGTMTGAASTMLLATTMDVADPIADAARVRCDRLKPRVSIIPQAKVLQYRVDFLIKARFDRMSEEPCRIVVECDGAEFHSTVEQRKRDAARQAEIEQALVADVIRFSGSQIHVDARLCAQIVVNRAIEMHLSERGLQRFAELATL